MKSRSMLVGVALVVVLCSAAVVNIAAPGAMSQILEHILDLVSKAGPWGTALFVMLQIAIAASGILPAALLGVAAGAAYGVTVGFGLSAFGTLLGAWIAFRLTRSLFRDRIERMLANRPKLRGFDVRLGRENWKLVCLLRVSPVMPFAITSYALGASSVSTRAYMLGSLAAMPALLGYVVLGSLAHAGLQAGQTGSGPFRWGILVLGFVATAVLTARIGWIIRAVLSEDHDLLSPQDAA